MNEYTEPRRIYSNNQDREPIKYNQSGKSGFKNQRYDAAGEGADVPGGAVVLVEVVALVVVDAAVLVNRAGAVIPVDGSAG